MTESDYVSITNGHIGRIESIHLGETDRQELLAPVAYHPIVIMRVDFFSPFSPSEPMTADYAIQWVELALLVGQAEYIRDQLPADKRAIWDGAVSQARDAAPPPDGQNG